MKTIFPSVGLAFLWCAISVTSATNLCFLPMATGNCRGSFPSYYYNAVTCRCERFIYGGCGGNENRFSTLDECQSTCDGTPCRVCYARLFRGICSRTMLVSFWYFDATSCRCQLTRGCREGNANRFPSQDACEDMCGDHECRCNTPRVLGRCADRRWFYNNVTNMCRRYMSCDEYDYGKNFSSRQECNDICRYPCSLSRFVGPDSNDRQRRFFYNRRRNRCVRFRWGGVVSNANNFGSRMECTDACVRQ